jgi:hypothetical protein
MTGNIMTSYLRCVAVWCIRSAQKFWINLMPHISGCKNIHPADGGSRVLRIFLRKKESIHWKMTLQIPSKIW